MSLVLLAPAATLTLLQTTHTLPPLPTAWEDGTRSHAHVCAAPSELLRVQLSGIVADVALSLGQPLGLTVRLEVADISSSCTASSSSSSSPSPSASSSLGQVRVVREVREPHGAKVRAPVLCTAARFRGEEAARLPLAGLRAVRALYLGCDLKGTPMLWVDEAPRQPAGAESAACPLNTGGTGTGAPARAALSALLVHSRAHSHTLGEAALTEVFVWAEPLVLRYPHETVARLALALRKLARTPPAAAAAAASPPPRALPANSPTDASVGESTGRRRAHSSAAAREQVKEQATQRERASSGAGGTCEEWTDVDPHTLHLQQLNVPSHGAASAELLHLLAGSGAESPCTSRSLCGETALFEPVHFSRGGCKGKESPCTSLPLPLPLPPASPGRSWSAAPRLSLSLELASLVVFCPHVEPPLAEQERGGGEGASEGASEGGSVAGSAVEVGASASRCSRPFGVRGRERSGSLPACAEVPDVESLRAAMRKAAAAQPGWREPGQEDHEASWQRGGSSEQRPRSFSAEGLPLLPLLALAASTSRTCAGHMRAVDAQAREARHSQAAHATRLQTAELCELPAGPLHVPLPCLALLLRGVSLSSELTAGRACGTGDGEGEEEERLDGSGSTVSANLRVALVEVGALHAANLPMAWVQPCVPFPAVVRHASSPALLAPLASPALPASSGEVRDVVDREVDGALPERSVVCRVQLALNLSLLERGAQQPHPPLAAARGWADSPQHSSHSPSAGSAAQLGAEAGAAALPARAVHLSLSLGRAPCSNFRTQPEVHCLHAVVGTLIPVLVDECQLGVLIGIVRSLAQWRLHARATAEGEHAAGTPSAAAAAQVSAGGVGAADATGDLEDGPRGPCSSAPAPLANGPSARRPSSGAGSRMEFSFAYEECSFAVHLARATAAPAGALAGEGVGERVFATFIVSQVRGHYARTGLEITVKALRLLPHAATPAAPQPAAGQALFACPHAGSGAAAERPAFRLYLEESASAQQLEQGAAFRGGAAGSGEAVPGAAPTFALVLVLAPVADWRALADLAAFFALAITIGKAPGWCARPATGTAEPGLTPGSGPLVAHRPPQLELAPRLPAAPARAAPAAPSTLVRDPLVFALRLSAVNCRLAAPAAANAAGWADGVEICCEIELAIRSAVESARANGVLERRKEFALGVRRVSLALRSERHAPVHAHMALLSPSPTQPFTEAREESVEGCVLAGVGVELRLLRELVEEMSAEEGAARSFCEKTLSCLVAPEKGVEKEVRLSLSEQLVTAAARLVRAAAQSLPAARALLSEKAVILHAARLDLLMHPPAASKAARAQLAAVPSTARAASEWSANDLCSGLLAPAAPGRSRPRPGELCECERAAPDSACGLAQTEAIVGWRYARPRVITRVRALSEGAEASCVLERYDRFSRCFEPVASLSLLGGAGAELHATAEEGSAEAKGRGEAGRGEESKALAAVAASEWRLRAVGGASLHLLHTLGR
ncbi:hypothetical protein T492DRAFT_836018 [Pavlovales sp. CCMP2436]|nr:hypothetical protein T492DRAFT_836018 [Pavlovales sp. CCMP2436]